MIKVALAEDKSFLAKSLLEKLSLFPELKVKFHAIHGADLLVKLEADSNIDVILMDIQMPQMDGIEATKAISKLYPHIRIVMLTVMDSEQSIYEAIQSGAVGYLVKESGPQEIFDGIREATEGRGALSPGIALKAMRIIQNPEVVSRESADFGLTAQELKVLEQICQGLDYRKIAANLIISPNTVRAHKTNLYRKLEVNNQVEAVQKAQRFGLV